MKTTELIKLAADNLTSDNYLLADWAAELLGGFVMLLNAERMAPRTQQQRCFNSGEEKYYSNWYKDAAKQGKSK